MTRVGVLVHGGDDALGEALVGAVSRAHDLGEVRAVEVVGRTEVLAPACARLAEVAEVVIGLGAAPWPGWSIRHAAAHDALGDVPYWAVESWHGLPALHDHLVAAVGERWQDGTRVLLTAPDDAIRDLPPEQRVVLRDVAEALHGRTEARPVIAVDRSPDEGAVTPTAVTTVTTLAEAHDAERVVRVSLAPGDGPDPAVAAAAFASGIQLSDVTLHSDDQVALLLDVVRTMLQQALPSGGAA